MLFHVHEQVDHEEARFGGASDKVLLNVIKYMKKTWLLYLQDGK